MVEEPEMALLPHLLDSQGVSIDIGANFAYYTVRLAELCSEGHVYAFEPIPFTCRVCSKVIRHFGLSNVSLFEKGVGERDARLRFEVPVQKAGSLSAGQAHLSSRSNMLPGKEKYHNFEQHRSFDCDVVSIDSFLPDLRRLDFVKIDIEGAELLALKGMKRTLERLKPVVLIEVCPFFLRGFGISEEDLRSQVASTGFQFFRVSESRRRLDLYDGAFEDGNHFLIHRSRQASLCGQVFHA
jgi:FkbM family methyltransferase